MQVYQINASIYNIFILFEVLMEIEPSIILTTSKQDEILKQVLTNYGTYITTIVYN